MTYKLYHQDILDLAPGTIFAEGKDERYGYWVAVRGGMPDWAVYSRSDSVDPLYIKDYGDKVFGPHAVQLVGASPDLAKWYRN